jgi:basic amino acid/polyamine antiporter, APA family
MSTLVMISALGALNGLILTGARIYVAAGADFSTFRVLARWHARWQTPVAAIAVQMVISVGLVLLLGHETGRRLFSAMVQGMGFGAPSWEGHGGFDTLLKSTAPVFWLFFFLTGLSLFVLRAKDHTLARAFTVPGYPVVPAVFCATCLYMLYSAVTYAGMLSLVGMVPPLVGVVVYLFFGRSGQTLSGPAGPPPSVGE